MLNQVMLLGRMVSNLDIATEKEEKASELTIAVQRPFKNEEGIYETDFIKVYLFNSISQNTSMYLKKGDTIGIKGKLSMNDNKLIVIAERVMFLSSNRNMEEEGVL